MSENTIGTGKNVLRANSTAECGLPVGQMRLVIKGHAGYEVVSFYCTEPKLHTSECRFVGNELIVTRRHR